MFRKGLFLVSTLTLLFVLFYLSSAHSQKGVISKEEASCYQCHEEIKSLKVGNKHAPLPCAKCHGKLAEHLKDPEKLPETNLELSVCGQCHASQYETYVSVNLKSKAKVEKATTTSRSPTLKKLVDIDPNEETAVLALVRRGKRDRIVAVGRFVIDHEKGT